MKKCFSIIIVLIVILQSSCNPCKVIDCPNPFTEEEKQWLPYSYNDSIIFSDTSSDDSFVYRVYYEQSGKHEERESGSPYCMTACVYLSEVSGEIIYSNGTKDSFGFFMYKNLQKLHLSSGGSSGYIFKLENAIQIDSLLINGEYLKKIYKYVCTPSQLEVTETYMHQGLGLVKIVFRNGQEFELVEHIRAE